MLIENTRTDAAFAAHPAAAPHIGSFVGVPIRLADGELFGTLCAVDPEPRAFSPRQVELLVVLARLVATQIERARAEAARAEALAARRAAEARLRDEARFRSLVANATDLITILDPAGAIRYESPAIERVLGYDPEELVGADAFALVHPDDRAATWDAFAATLADPAFVPTVEFRFRHRDGSWRWLEATGTNLLADSDVGGVVVNSRDVTERRRLAEEAARAEALAESDRLKSALLAAVSHELRTPLATIKVATGSLLSPTAVWTEQDRAEFLRAVDAEADRLARTVDNLLDLSRIEGGVLRPDTGWHDAAALVAETAAHLRGHAAAHRVVVELAPGLPPACFDRDQVGRVLTNLGENAVKHTAPGTTVTFSARALPGAVELAVRDDGPGIPADELPRVFDRFSRGSRSTGVPGAGIGLAICKGLVEAHGGRIWAESREGEGTTVRLTLPLAPPEGGAA